MDIGGADTSRLVDWLCVFCVFCLLVLKLLWLCQWLLHVLYVLLLWLLWRQRRMMLLLLRLLTRLWPHWLPPPELLLFSRLAPLLIDALNHRALFVGQRGKDCLDAPRLLIRLAVYVQRPGAAAAAQTRAHVGACVSVRESELQWCRLQ